MVGKVSAQSPGVCGVETTAEGRKSRDRSIKGSLGCLGCLGEFLLEPKLADCVNDASES